MTSWISATQASTQRWGMAFSRWYCVDKPLVLTLPPQTEGKGLDAEGETGPSWLGLCSGEFAPVSAGAAEPVDRDD